MKKLLTLFLLLIPMHLMGEWKYNPHTNKLDYYKESVSTAAYSQKSSTANFATASSNANTLNGYAYTVFLTTTEAYNVFMSTGVKKLLAGTNITLSPLDGRGDVTVNAIVPPGVSYFVNKATENLNMNNYGIYSASGVYVSTGNGRGYMQHGNQHFWLKEGDDILGAINAADPGATIELGRGTWTVNAQTNIFKDNITIVGQGDATVIVAAPWASWASPGHIFYSSGTSGLTISNLKIDGLAANTGQAKNLINLQLCSYVTLSYIWCDYSDNHGMYIEGSNFVKVEKNIFTNCDSDACRFYGYDNIKGAYSGGYQSEFSHNVTRGCATGVTVQYCRVLKVSSNYFWGCTGWALQSDQLNYGITIVDNTVFGGTGSGLYFYGTTTNGFNCGFNNISCAGVGALIQGDISAGSFTNNTIIITGANHAVEIGTYNNVSNINVGNNNLVNAGNNKASIYAGDMSYSQITNNNCSNTSTGQSEQAFRLVKGTGNVISSNIGKNQDTADFQIDAFCFDNRLLNNICNDPVKIIDNGRKTTLETIQDGNFGFGVSSPTVRGDFGGDTKMKSTYFNGTYSVGIDTPSAVRQFFVDVLNRIIISTGTSNAWDYIIK